MLALNLHWLSESQNGIASYRTHELIISHQLPTKKNEEIPAVTMIKKALIKPIVLYATKSQNTGCLYDYIP
jgi:hypothetical protein